MTAFTPGFGQSVFHYTDAPGLLGIIKDKCLWASEASSLNDLAELRQGLLLIESWLEEQPNSTSRGELRGFFELPPEKRHEVFVLSGSTRPDDANQWRSYGDAGRGYVVELDASADLAVLSDSREEPAPEGAEFYIDVASEVRVSPWQPALYEPESGYGALTSVMSEVEDRQAWVRAAKDQEIFIERVKRGSDRRLGRVIESGASVQGAGILW